MEITLRGDRGTAGVLADPRRERHRRAHATAVSIERGSPRRGRPAFFEKAFQGEGALSREAGGPRISRPFHSSERTGAGSCLPRVTDLTGSPASQTRDSRSQSLASEFQAPFGPFDGAFSDAFPSILFRRAPCPRGHRVWPTANRRREPPRPDRDPHLRGPGPDVRPRPDAVEPWPLARHLPGLLRAARGASLGARDGEAVRRAGRHPNARSQTVARSGAHTARRSSALHSPIHPSVRVLK